MSAVKRLALAAVDVPELLTVRTADSNGAGVIGVVGFGDELNGFAWNAVSNDLLSATAILISMGNANRP